MAKNLSTGQAIIGLACGASFIWWFAVGGSSSDPITQHSMENIQAKVADDAVAQYGIAKRNGSATDACVQAGAVAAAFLQSKDESNYAKWKITEKADCERAGLSQ